MRFKNKAWCSYKIPIKVTRIAKISTRFVLVRLTQNYRMMLIYSGIARDYKIAFLKTYSVITV